jgi:hypothetical protein
VSARARGRAGPFPERLTGKGQTFRKKSKGWTGHRMAQEGRGHLPVVIKGQPACRGRRRAATQQKTDQWLARPPLVRATQTPDRPAQAQASRARPARAAAGTAPPPRPPSRTAPRWLRASPTWGEAGRGVWGLCWGQPKGRWTQCPRSSCVRRSLLAPTWHVPWPWTGLGAPPPTSTLPPPIPPPPQHGDEADAAHPGAAD